MKKLLTLYYVLVLVFITGCSREDTMTTEMDDPEPSRIHSSFTFTPEEFDSQIRPFIPGTVRSHPDSGEFDSQGFLDLAEAMLKGDPHLLLIVDKTNSLPSDYVPSDLINLDNLAVLNKNRSGHQLREIAIPSLMEMTRDAAEEGLTLLCSSAYRSYVYQVKTYNYWVDKLGKDEADRVSAQPGKSQHQLGLALDFGSIEESYENDPEGVWQLENAWKYGWSLSYPKGMEKETGYSYEPWHYRYIGKEAARMEREFFSGKQFALLEFWALMEPRLRDALLEEETI